GRGVTPVRRPNLPRPFQPVGRYPGATRRRSPAMAVPCRPLAALLLAAGVASAQPPADPLPEHALARFGTDRFRTASSVTALAFSPDGQRLASWGSTMAGGDRFALWDAGSGKELRTVPTTTRQLLALAWPAH